MATTKKGAEKATKKKAAKKPTKKTATKERSPATAPSDREQADADRRDELDSREAGERFLKEQTREHYARRGAWAKRNA